MTALSIRNDEGLILQEVILDAKEIANELSAIGVQFEQWRAEAELASDADSDTVQAAYRADIDKLNAQYGFQSVDVVALRPDHPQRAEMRQKFLTEHAHADFEVRFFVEGSGLFYLHVELEEQQRVYLLLCEQGDLISVPANTTHWFDMGENPNFKCIRFFTTPDGWVANFTQSGIDALFPSFDEFVQELQ